MRRRPDWEGLKESGRLRSSWTGCAGKGGVCSETKRRPGPGLSAEHGLGSSADRRRVLVPRGRYQIADHLRAGQAGSMPEAVRTTADEMSVANVQARSDGLESKTSVTRLGKLSRRQGYHIVTGSCEWVNADADLCLTMVLGGGVRIIVEDDEMGGEEGFRRRESHGAGAGELTL